MKRNLQEKSSFKEFKRKENAELRPYEKGEKLSKKVSISKADKDNGSPKVGDMIARNPKNHEDQWLVAKKYFKDNFEDIDSDDNKKCDKEKKNLQEFSSIERSQIRKIFYKHIPGNDPEFKDDVIDAIVDVYKRHEYGVALNEWGFPNYEKEDIEANLSPLNDEIIKNVLKAKENYFSKKPASFYGIDAISPKTDKEMQLTGKDLISFIILQLNKKIDDKGIAFKEAVEFLKTLV